MTLPFPALTEDIIRPTLQDLDMWSPAAENLVHGTALAESGLRYLRQQGGGPALGLWQMEPATIADVKRYMSLRLPIHDKVKTMAVQWPVRKQEVVWNLKLACALCRIRYWYEPDRLPDADDWSALAAYWKQHYNTPLGRGTVEHFLKATRELRRRN